MRNNIWIPSSTNKIIGELLAKCFRLAATAYSQPSQIFSINNKQSSNNKPNFLSLLMLGNKVCICNSKSIIIIVDRLILACNLLLAAIVGMAGGVVTDQAEADEEMSVKQRLILAGGSVLAEGGGAVGDLTGVQVAADGLEVAGEYVGSEAAAWEGDPVGKGRSGKGQSPLVRKVQPHNLH